jgi:hypothetical protein
MERRSARLKLNFARPGVFSWRLVEMPVYADVYQMAK